MRIIPSIRHYSQNEFMPMNSTIMSQFTEQQILELQHQLLNPGFHHLTVESIEQGRSIMMSFLSSLGCYDRIASVTLGSVELPENIEDIYHHLACGRYLGLPDGISSFLIDFWPMDFLWVEENDALKQQEWYFRFERALIDLNYDQHIPIMILSYAQDPSNSI